MRKYEPLGEYLQNQPEDVETVTLTFAEIEGILGFALPPYVHRIKQAWTNQANRFPSRAWMSAGWKARWPDLEAQTVVFYRAKVELKPREPRTHSRRQVRDTDEYGFLQALLQAMPPDQAQIVLSLDDIRVLSKSRTLPSAAGTRGAWWGNSKSTPQANAWLSAGWCCEEAFPSVGLVVFRRQGHDAVSSIQRYVNALLEGPVPVVHPTACELRGWIRLCRQIGWYFQGTVLYEKGGTALQGLTGEDAEAVEEDYAVCKRELANDLLEQTLGTFRTLFGGGP